MEEVIELPQGINEISEKDCIKFDVCLTMDHIGVTVTIICLNNRIGKNLKGFSKDKDGRWKMIRKCNLVVFKNVKPLLQYSLVESKFVYNKT